MPSVFLDKPDSRDNVNSARGVRTREGRNLLRPDDKGYRRPNENYMNKDAKGTLRTIRSHHADVRYGVTIPKQYTRSLSYQSDRTQTRRKPLTPLPHSDGRGPPDLLDETQQSESS